ncbi:NADP-dependent oxidoreductase [Actinoplanes sp. NPDC026623]|uniref:NADP-dependent oxidoreductase n=1 Tax=Actinoplanes sp. NPDC026623 TaxID=3155610 RepID=UPI0033D2A37A
MKAIQFEAYGGPDVLRLVEVEAPCPGPGQVRIAVRAAGVNGIDWKIRAGHLRERRPLDLPAGTGIDAAGIVDEIGEGVEGVALGDAVFGSGSATYAEQAVLAHWARKPEGLPFTEAAGFPVAVETAFRIIDQVGVRAGQTLLISGAAGGVGSAAVQIAKARGISVIGTAGAGNQDYLRGLGAVATTYGPGLVERVRALADAGVDAALDIAGSGVIADLVELTGDPARVLSIADFSAAAQGARVSFAAVDPERAFTEAARLFEAGALRLPVMRAYPLADAAGAQAASAAGHATGRIVITIR